MKSTLTLTTPTPETSFRLFLQSELARRCARNSQYSLRAFAVHVNVDHSTLSQWLRGRRPLPRAFELVSRVRQQLVELLQDGAADDVYQIEIALFPVTTGKRTAAQLQ